MGSLLRRGGEVDVLDSGGATPLMLACHQGNPQLGALIDLGASMGLSSLPSSCLDETGCRHAHRPCHTRLHSCTHIPVIPPSHTTTTVQLLLDYSASVTARTTVARNSVMHFAAKNG